MPSKFISRRRIACHLAALPAGLGLATRVLGASNGDGLSRGAEAIHQEMRFKASRKRVYDALTSSNQFDAITRLSDAVTLVTAPNAEPTSISSEVGGPFTLFGGIISGRNLELRRDGRLVQAWRERTWEPGDYSIVKFALSGDGPETKLIFDHRGFPDGDGAHLARGWHVHYWDPLAKFLSQV